MIDLRLWRIVLLAAPLALFVVMFSLAEVPQPLEPTLPPDAFDGEAAASLTRDLARQAPSPRPGSDQDQALADAVLARFKEIPGIEVSEQRFTGSYDGDDVELRNLIAVLPGESERQVAIMANRDVTSGSGAASTIASTAALLEIAAGFSGATHTKTLVFVSTDGGSIGALGARRFASDYSSAPLLDATIALSQPAANRLAPPMVVPWSTGDESTNPKLERTASAVVQDETEESPGQEGAFADLSRLAIPSALGEQGPLVESGMAAVRLSSAGELPLPAGSDEEKDVDTETLDRFGRSALSLMLAVDGARSPLEAGPRTYIGLAGNLLPGWTLSLLALALLLPLSVAGIEGIARSASSPLLALRALGWVALRSVPLLAVLLIVYLGGLFGVIPSPDFPFTPSEQSLGRGGTIAVVLGALVFGALAFLLRPLLAPPPRLARMAPSAALTLAALVTFGVWLINPYLALLVAFGLQLWVLAATDVVPGKLATAGVVLAGLIPLVACVWELAGRFDAGVGVIWDLLYMLTGGQLGYGEALLGCLLGGVGLAIVATAGEPATGEDQPSLSALVARGRELEEGRAGGGLGGRRFPRPRRRRKSDEDGRGGRRSRRRRAPAPEASPEADEQPPPPEDDAQDEPREDPRMWSKPPGSSARPSAARTVISSPSITRPTWVSP